MGRAQCDETRSILDLEKCDFYSLLPDAEKIFKYVKGRRYKVAANRFR